MNANEKVLGRDLHLSFDVGHSSIGWAVLQNNAGIAFGLKKTDHGNLSVNLLGCGSVIYRADDCLASARRSYRRQRRHIRSTRQRIARMKVMLAYLRVLGKTELNQPGCAWPWLLATQVLRAQKSLGWSELWDVLRWYAHNRGYDGNRRWSAAEAEAEKEDSEKEANARTLMGKHATRSMAETFCKELGIEPDGVKKSSMKRFKGLNAAFPREIVENEVRQILRSHFGKLSGVNADLETALFADWRAIPCPGLKLPNRFQGGLLFGQLVPRFDNRIISICPITYSEIYERELKETGEPKLAECKAKTLAKVPSRNCPEFLNFRWAMQLANVQVARFGEHQPSPVTAKERVDLDKQMRQRGGMTSEQFKKAVRTASGAIRDNLDTMLMHPDAKDALLLDPVQKLVCSDDLQPFWKVLPERLQKRLRGQWRRGKVFSLAEIRRQLGLLDDVSNFDTEVQNQLDARNTKARKKETLVSAVELLRRHFPPKPIKLDGRAAFARHLLKKACEEVLAGTHPKEAGGCLFITEEVRQRQMNREIAAQTNNHLVRHRLLILERLLRDIILEYAVGDKTRIAKITIEVNRDLREMSGMTAKQKAQDLDLRIANHHAVAANLEKAFADERFNGRAIPITAGLIRKARIAEDLGWKCPYTGKEYEPKDLITRYVDKDHIVPRADRASDSLDSLAVTFSAVNKWKGKRTAWQFVQEEQGKAVPDLPNLSILSLARYKELVEGLECYRGHDDDKRRKRRRKDLMLLPEYEQKEFIPRDLTQTSQLVRLGAQVLRRAFADREEKPVVVSLPGSVTGTVRKAWKVLGCLSLANPQVVNENGEMKNKTEIRDVTHLHHALDACVLGLASHFIPNNGRVWELIVKRNPGEAEKRDLMALGVFGFNAENRFEMRDLDNRLKEQICQRLSEKRVVQHVPARMDGLRVEQNTWRVVSVKGGEATIQQRIRQPDGSRPWKRTEEKVTKLLGLEPASGKGKLGVNKGALIIPDNYGVALDPQPTIIQFHKVWDRLQHLKKTNGGAMPRILRSGQLVRVPEGKFKGVWRVFSAKNNATGIAVDMGQPDVVRLKNKTEGHKINVLLSSLLKNKMNILKTPLTGIASLAGHPRAESA
jgi:CRISPR-associated endonuclease Csn1